MTMRHWITSFRLVADGDMLRSFAEFESRNFRREVKGLLMAGGRGGGRRPSDRPHSPRKIFHLALIRSDLSRVLEKGAGGVSSQERSYSCLHSD